MKFAATLSILAFIGVSWALGLRLLGLARTTRQTPELCMGSSLLLIGGFGYPFALLSSLPGVQGTTLGSLAFALCSWSVHAGVMATLLFVYLVFRRDSSYAGSAVWGSAALLLVTGFAQTHVAFLGLSREATNAANLWPAVGLLTMATLAYGWSAAESLHYWGLMRRRRTVGLADPVSTHRFLLWGVSGAAMVIGAAANLIASVATPLSVMHPLALLVTSVCGFTSSAALVLTFVPPASYVTWLEAQGA